MTTVLFIEGWILVGLSLAAAYFCWHNQKVTRLARLTKTVSCMVLGLSMVLGLVQVLDSEFSLVLILAAVGGMLVGIAENALQL